MTAPNGPSQQACIAGSMREAGNKASDINLAECHGTGTALGDPIEVGALKNVMHPRETTLALTSSKSNIGHLEGSAGIAGFMKCVLMLMAGTCPPNVHLYQLNPHLDVKGFPCLFDTEAPYCTLCIQLATLHYVSSAVTGKWTMSMISDDKLVRTPVRQSVREVQLRPDALVEKQSEPLTEDHPRDKDAKSEEESFGKLQTPFRGVGTVAVIQAFLIVEVVIESESDEVCVCWWETPVPRDRKLTRAAIDPGLNSALTGVSSFGFGGTNGRCDIWGAARFGPNKCGKVMEAEVDQIYTLCPVTLGKIDHLTGEPLGKRRADVLRDELARYDVSRLAYDGGFRYRQNPVPSHGEGDLLQDRNIFICGSWTGFKMEEMDKDGDNLIGPHLSLGILDVTVFTTVITLSEERYDLFELYVDEKEELCIFPAVDRAGQQIATEGPGVNKEHNRWIIDGRDTELAAGTVLQITFNFNPDEMAVTWKEVGEKHSSQILVEFMSACLSAVSREIDGHV
eukprot:s2296_g7.t2